jgi:prepilin-type N-terminal cleavage/methylation domain-containing protein
LKKGFTLIELMVVLAVMGIITAIAVPSFTGYIRKTQVNDIVREAKLNEDTCMQIAGMQYSYAGNPHVFVGTAPTSSDTRAESAVGVGKQYFYLDASALSPVSGTPAIRGSLANAFSSGEGRESEGIKEYRQRTSLPFAPVTPPSYAAVTTYLWFEKPTDSELAGMNNNANSYYFHYDLLWSEYWFTKNGVTFGVFHGLKWGADNPDGNSGERGDTLAGGWFVYEFKDGKWRYYGEQGG